MKEIYRTTSLEEAQVFCALLREHELEPLLDGEKSGLVTLGLYTSAAPLIIYVPDEHEASAGEVLDAVIRERKGEVVFESSTDIESSSPEEEARFQDWARRSRSRGRRLWIICAVIMFFPLPILLVAALANGDGEGAYTALLYTAPLVLAALVIWLLARGKRAPRSTPNS